MVARVGTIHGKILIQIGENDPVEVGAVEIPVPAEKRWG